MFRPKPASKVAIPSEAMKQLGLCMAISCEMIGGRDPSHRVVGRHLALSESEPNASYCDLRTRQPKTERSSERNRKPREIIHIHPEETPTSNSLKLGTTLAVPI